MVMLTLFLVFCLSLKQSLSTMTWLKLPAQTDRQQTDSQTVRQTERQIVIFPYLM